MSSSDFEVASISTGSSDAQLSPADKRSRKRGPGYPVFRDHNGNPVAFAYAESVSGEKRTELNTMIEHHGGIVLDRGDPNVNTLLVKTKEEKILERIACSASRNQARSRLVVEHISFVNQCIQNKTFIHTSSKVTPMTGVGEGRGRTAFTTDDFEKLAWYISRLIPDPNAGGRHALSFYKTLVTLGDRDEEYSWARRHTAESWKENIKRNKAKYNERIAEMVHDHPLAPDQQQWLRNRRMTKRALLSQRTGSTDEEEANETDSGEESWESAQFEKPSRKRRRSENMPSNKPAAKRRLSDKGKERALEYEEEASIDEQWYGDDDVTFEHESHDHTLDIGSPERTLIASARNQPSASSSRILREKDANEATVPIHSSPPSPRLQLSGKRDNLSTTAQKHENTNARKVPGRTPLSSSSQIEGVPETRMPQHRNSSPPRTREVIDVDEPSPPYPVQALQSNNPPRKVVTRSKAERTARKTVPSQPLRTSLRQRSVEPEILPLPGRRVKTKAIPIPEESEEEVENPKLPMGETYVEEDDVANLLVPDEADESMAVLERGVSMDSDDAQIAHALQQGTPAASSAATRPKFDIFAPPPYKVLNRVNAARRQSMVPGTIIHSLLPHPQSGTRQDMQTNQPPHRGPRHSAPHFQNRTVPVTPRTPVRGQRGSSVESFPLSGTRARDFVLGTRDMPYKPLQGTRAAAFAGDSPHTPSE